MEGRNGVKIGYLAIIIAIPTVIIKLVSLFFSIVGNWTAIGFGSQIVISLILLFGPVFIGILTYYTIQALRKPELIEEQYKFPGWGIVVGLSLCVPVVLEIVFQGQFMYGDVITSSMFFLIGVLLIISGIIMLQEVKGGTEEIQAE